MIDCGQSRGFSFAAFSFSLSYYLIRATLKYLEQTIFARQFSCLSLWSSNSFSKIQSAKKISDATSFKEQDGEKCKCVITFGVIRRREGKMTEKFLLKRDTRGSHFYTRCQEIILNWAVVICEKFAHNRVFLHILMIICHTFAHT